MFLTENVLTELAKARRTSPVAHYPFQLLTTLLKILGGGNKFNSALVSQAAASKERLKCMEWSRNVCEEFEEAPENLHPWQRRFFIFQIQNFGHVIDTNSMSNNGFCFYCLFSSSRLLSRP